MIRAWRVGRDMEREAERKMLERCEVAAVREQSEYERVASVAARGLLVGLVFWGLVTLAIIIL